MRARCASAKRFVKSLTSPARNPVLRTFARHGLVGLCRNMSALDQNLLEAALRGLEAQRERLEEHIANVRRLMRGGAAAGRRPGRPAKAAPEPEPETAAPPARKRRRFSAAVRKRLADAMRQRWAVKRTASQAADKRRAATKAAAKRAATKTATKKVAAKRPVTKKRGAKKKAVTSSQVFGRKTLNSPGPRKQAAAKKGASASSAAAAAPASDEVSS